MITKCHFCRVDVSEPAVTWSMETAMQRRHFLIGSMAGASFALFAHSAPRVNAASGEATADKSTVAMLPKRDRVRVAFLLGEHANVIDTMGPWEVFQDATVPGNHAPFELYTVAPTHDDITMTGGLIVRPRYSVEDAPQPHVIVVPAQRSTESSRAWLRSASARTDVTMSVCTGAFQLGRVGLLDGRAATTHHEFFDAFAKEFPNVELRRGLRFVDNGRIATAGGLTSGIDMALHVVARYLGVEAARRTAEYMEYTSEGWRA
jgi:transcriptional regulator GlxA family with amidase domain